MTLPEHGPESLQVNVSLYGVIRDITRQKTFTISLPQNATVKELLNQLASVYAEELRERFFDSRGQLRKNVKLFANQGPIDGADEKVNTEGRVMHEVTVIVLSAAAGG